MKLHSVHYLEYAELSIANSTVSDCVSRSFYSRICELLATISVLIHLVLYSDNV